MVVGNIYFLFIVLIIICFSLVNSVLCFFVDCVELVRNFVIIIVCLFG